MPDDATVFYVSLFFERNVRISVISQEINAKKEWDHGFTVVKKLDAIAARRSSKRVTRKRSKFLKMPCRARLWLILTENLIFFITKKILRPRFFSPRWSGSSFESFYTLFSSYSRSDFMKRQRKKITIIIYTIHKFVLIIKLTSSFLLIKCLINACNRGFHSCFWRHSGNNFTW